jgi:RNA polymerase sigma factor (sigma-70 family)
MNRHPVLGRQQEADLAGAPDDRASGAIDALVCANLSFVVRVAAQHRHLGLPFEDLVSEGCLGLLEAARRFDARRGARFITYAVWWIRKAILRAGLENGTLVRPSAYHYKKRKEFAAEERALARELGRRPDTDELSARLGQPRRQIESSLRERVSLISLDEQPGGEGGRTLAETLADQSLESAEDGLLRGEAADLVKQALLRLSDQERRVLGARFGLTGGEPLTLREVGEQMCLSRERVRQIEKHGRRKIRKFLHQQTRPRIGPQTAAACEAAPQGPYAELPLSGSPAHPLATGLLAPRLPHRPGPGK